MDHATYELFAREEGRGYGGGGYHGGGGNGCMGCLIIALAPFVALGAFLMLLEACGVKL